MVRPQAWKGVGRSCMLLVVLHGKAPTHFGHGERTAKNDEGKDRELEAQASESRATSNMKGTEEMGN